MGCRKLQYYFRDGVISDHHRDSGSIPNRFAFRFSSEYHDSETNLVYYNYRYYSPELGRWLSRDPIGERGGYNLYGMVGNNSINWWDYLGNGREGWIPDYFQGKEGWIPDYFQGKEGWIPDALQPTEIEKSTANFAYQAITNRPVIDLNDLPGIVDKIQKDPSVQRAYAQIDKKVLKKIMTYKKPDTCDIQLASFSINGKYRLELGGQRGSFNPFSPSSSATWKVASNPLTWMVRHATVTATTSVLLIYNCEFYFGVYSTPFSINDTLDLRPHKHGKNDFSVLLNPTKDPYDTVTVPLGTLYHDILRRSDQIKVQASWIYFNVQAGEW